VLGLRADQAAADDLLISLQLKSWVASCSERLTFYLRVALRHLPHTWEAEPQLILISKYLEIKGLLVDLIGIEPMTSSMPWNERKPKLLTEHGLRVGTVGKNGPIGGICDKNATNFLAAGHGLIVWDQPRFFRGCGIHRLLKLVQYQVFRHANKWPGYFRL
jgi:hypothetical protein